MGKRTAAKRLAGLLLGAGLVVLFFAGGILWYSAIHGSQPPIFPATPSSGSSESIRLAWDKSPSTKVTGYKILFGSQPGNYTDSVDVGDVATATLSGLKSGTKYYVVVVAVDGRGNQSPPSNELQVVIPK